MLGQCSLLLQNALRNQLETVGGDRFTFTVYSYFHRTGIVVPHNSHATKSTPIPKIIRPTSSDKTQLFPTQTPTPRTTTK